MDNAELLKITGRGWKVFPCGTDKKPLTQHGFLDASSDLTQIEAWRKKFPGALWGIACQDSGFFAVDLDVPNGPETWKKWTEEHGKPPAGPIQKTPSGGWHLLYKLPEIRIPNNSGKLAAGVDLRSTGYICTGAGYVWGKDGKGISAPLPEAPDWLLKKIEALTIPKQPAGIEGSQSIPEINPTEAAGFWLAKALQKAYVGNRNQTGFDLACQLRDTGLAYNQAERIIIQYAANVPGTDYSEAEALASLQSAYNGTPREPAKLPIRKDVPMPEPPEPEYPPDFYPQEEPRRYTVRNAAYALEPQPPIDYLVDRLIIPAGIHMFFGNPGAKKTYSLLSMSVCAALGKNWLGYTTRKAKVLWIDEESGEDHMARRLGEAIRGELGNENTPIEFVCLAGWQLDDKTDPEILRMLIEERQADIVIIDALADVMGGDENTVKDVRPVFLNLKRIADKTKAAIIVIHHSNKLGGYRGSSFILGNVDLMVHVKSEDGGQFIDFKTEKVRHGEKQTWSARAVWEDNEFYLQSEATKKHAESLSPSETFVIKYLKEHGDSTVSIIASNADVCSDVAAKRAVYTLANSGLTERKNPGGKQSIYGLTEKGKALEV